MTLCKTLLILFIILLSPLQTLAQNPVLYNGAGASVQDKIIALTLAGIVNRDTARLYLLNVYETWSYNRTDETWRDIYRARGGVVFDSVQLMSALINKFRHLINGAITYDAARYYSNFTGQNFPWQAEAAALIGSLTNRIPATASYASTLGLQTADSVLVTDPFDGDTPEWVTGKVDAPVNPWNQSGLSEEQRYMAWLDWGITTLLPRCNPDMFYLREYTDWTSKNRMFQLNLAGTEDLNFNSLPAAKADLIERVLLFMQNKNPNRIFHIYGWMRPEPLTQWFAHFGSSFHETLLGNLSWHSSFPSPRKSFPRSSVINPDTMSLKNKYYLLFVSTEGDASNWVLGLQSGAWLSAYRGQAAIGWGWNLHLLNQCPFAADYYSSTATAKDGFISVTSPLGYAYPDLWGSAAQSYAINKSRTLMDSFYVNNIYGYKHYASTGTINYRGKVINNSFDFVKYGQFQKNIGAELTFTFDPILPTQYYTQNYGSLIFNHVNDNTFYSDVSNLNTTASRILTHLNGKTKPYFYLAGYQRFRQDDFTSRSDPGNSDISVQRLVQLQSMLKADPNIGQDIEIVTPEVFSYLLRRKLWLTATEEPLSDNSESLISFPNPFSVETRIVFNLKKIKGADRSTRVTLKIYDILGSEVAELLNTEDNSRTNEIIFNPQQYSLAGGVYICRLTAGDRTFQNKLLYIK